MAKLLILATTLFAAMVLLSASSVSVDSADGEKPITKVVNLLKDMQAQLAEDQKKDVEIYDMMVCWCQTNDKVKTKAIADAEAHLEDLETSIEELTANSAQLKTDTETLTKEIAANEKALRTATELRGADNAEFTEEEQDSVQMIGGLDGAVQELGKHHSTPGAELEQPAEAADAQVSAFLQTRQTKAVSEKAEQPVAAKSYSSQSGGIFGILRTMKENMEGDLASAQKREAKASSSHEKLASSKTDELSAARQQLGEKRQELADTDENLANDKTDQRDTSATLEADRVFLADLKDRCGKMDEQWAARSKMRAEETQAVSEAIAILADDDAKDLAHKTVGSSFMQASSISNVHKHAQMQAATVLRQIAAKLHKPTLASLASLLQNGDVFAKILESITTMEAQLKTEQKEEVKQNDYCRAELQKNEVELNAGYESKDDLEGKMEDLKNLIKELSDRINQANNDVNTQHIELKKAAENRGKENLAFQMEIKDQRTMQAVLQKALDKLKAFYDGKATAFVQQAPPPGFKPYKKAGGSGGVVGFIMNIIGESVGAEKEAKAAEQEAQAAYEEFVETSNTLLKALEKSLADMATQKGKADQETVVTKESLGITYKNIMSLSDMNKGLHGECDYVIHNFEQRQKSRTEEIEGLQQAYQMLKGASFASA